VIICIPTKGRPETSTYKLFEASGHEVHHFIEPQDFDDYAVPNKVNIQANDQGLVYARNFIMDWARGNGHQFICMCDDDMTEFGVAVNNRCVSQPGADALSAPIAAFEKAGAAIGGFNARQYAWSEKKSYRLNAGKSEGVVLMNMRKIYWRYRGGMKQDRDFLMQCLDNRQNFIFFPKVYYGTPVIGTNKGGLHEQYATGVDAKAAYTLQKRWPEYSKIIEQHGRIDVRLDYKRKAADMGLKVI
jgi:glycosyltransferase involved in cell wall biosynthesis